MAMTFRVRGTDHIRRGLLAGSLAIVPMMAAGQTVSAEGFWPAQSLTVSDLRPSVQDVAAAGSVVAVTWTEEGHFPWRTSVAWSRDGGVTFPVLKTVTGHTASLVVCGGRIWLGTDRGPYQDDQRIRIDSWRADGTNHRTTTMSTGTRQPDLGCVGGKALAIGYILANVETSGARLRVWDLDGTQHLVHPVTATVGTARYDEADRDVAIATTGNHAYAVWTGPTDRRFRAFAVATGSHPTLHGQPSKQVYAGLGGGQAVVAASGRYVTIAFTRAAGARYRVSTDHGATFGPTRSIMDTPDPEDSTDVLSASMSGDDLLLEVLKLTVAGPDDFHWRSTGFSTYRATDRSLTQTSQHGGRQVGGFVQGHLVEAWDQIGSTATTTKVWFHREFTCAC